METKTFNGWANRETWNVALHINNNASLYKAAAHWMSHITKNGDSVGAESPYTWFIAVIGYEDSRTPDDVDWLSDKLDYDALNEMMWEII